MIDLHLHSCRSDGQLTPEELDGLMAELEYKGFSITDHNHIADDVFEMTLEEHQHGPKFVMGIEISTRDAITGESLHLLGYGNGMDYRRLNRELESVREGYNRRAERIIAKLNGEYPGFGLDFDRMLEESGAACLDRNRIAFALRAFRGDGSSIKELLPEAFVVDDDVPMPDTGETIRLLLSSGGLPVLAHPGRLADRDCGAFEKLLDRLADRGLWGLEVHYASHTAEQKGYLTRQTESRSLKMTGGSDWHGPDFSTGKEPGCSLTSWPFED